MSAYWKDTLREIARTPGRYISLIVITALGAAAVVGIMATSINMRAIADKTFKERRLYDIQVKSTTGFSDDDISALRDTSGVGFVMPANIFDTYMYFGHEAVVVRAFALPDGLNTIELTDGRLPEHAHECAVERSLLRSRGLSIGDSIRLGLDDMDSYYEVFEYNDFTITGVVVSPLFIIPYDRGATSLGDGRLSYYIYLPPDAYSLDVYTDVYIIMDESLNMDNLSDAYYNAVDEWLDVIGLTGDIRVLAKKDEFAEAQTEIDDGWQDYYDGFFELYEEVADGRRELDDAEKKLRDARIELEDGEVELADAVDKLEDAQETLDREIRNARADINRREQELEDGLAEIDENRATLESSQAELDGARAMLQGNLQMLEEIAPYGVSPELDMQYDTIYMSLELLDVNQAELDAGLVALETAEDLIQEGRELLRSARATLERERVDGQAEIDDGWAEIEENHIKINDGWVEYYDGLREWRDGVETLGREEADGLAKLADARAELIDAQGKLDDAPTPEWFYFTRANTQSFDSYYQDTLRLESIGFVFPVVFFVVAVLVSLTTMSRMVDEQRTQTGIYKALGYGTPGIIMKLLIYVFSAGVTGGILGAVLGSILFPRVIFNAYLHLYDMPQIETPIPAVLSISAISISVGIVMAVTVFTSLRTMSDSPAELMRPKAPPSGKRVLIEKITPLWNRLKFTHKVTARNIFRYKKRFIMTLAGVAGCTALLVTSFGLRDSLGAIGELQYGKLAHYTSRAYTKEISSDELRAQLDALTPGVWLYIREESISVEGVTYNVSMIIPEHAEELGGFMEFYSRKTDETVPLLSKGMFVTEKLARETGVSAGDYLSITVNSGAVITARVTGVVENYVSHHVFMSPDLYSELLGYEPLFNSLLIIADENSVDVLLDNSNVRAVIHTSDALRMVSDSTDALEVVAIVLIFLACALAFIVLFNLTNINIIERIRELATIKVLGFYNEELAMYIYRENTIVTLMGIVLGLVAGIFLHGYVLQAAEIDLLMFPRIILPLSYVYSVALSIAFAVFVNLVMNFRLARIDMVESLKNVE